MRSCNPLKLIPFLSSLNQQEPFNTSQPGRQFVVFSSAWLRTEDFLVVDGSMRVLSVVAKLRQFLFRHRIRLLFSHQRLYRTKIESDATSAFNRSVREDKRFFRVRRQDSILLALRANLHFDLQSCNQTWARQSARFTGKGVSQGSALAQQTTRACFRRHRCVAAPAVGLHRRRAIRKCTADQHFLDQPGIRHLVPVP